MVRRLRRGNSYVRFGNQYKTGMSGDPCCCACTQQIFTREPIVRFTRSARSYTTGDDGNYEPCNIWGVPSTYDIDFALIYGPYHNRASKWCQFLEDDSELDLTLSADPDYDYTFTDIRTMPEPDEYTGINPPSPNLWNVRAQELFSTDAGCVATPIAGWSASSFSAWNIEEITLLTLPSWTGYGQIGPSCFGTEPSRADCGGGNYSTFYTATVNKMWRIVTAEFVGSPCSTISVRSGSCDAGTFLAASTTDDELICMGPSATNFVAFVRVTVTYLESISYSWPDVDGISATLLGYATEYNPRGFHLFSFLGLTSMIRGSFQEYGPRPTGTTGYVLGGSNLYMPGFMTAAHFGPDQMRTIAVSEGPSYDYSPGEITNDAMQASVPCLNVRYLPLGTGIRPHCLHQPVNALICETWEENEPEEFAIATVELS